MYLYSNKMKEKYLKIENLSVSKKLLNFVNNELLPETKVKKDAFWKGFSKYAHQLALENKKLLEIREKLQKKIDDWHKETKGENINIKKYTKFLEKIGYLKKVGEKFKIKTKNVDREISKIAGPQLVVPVMNARYSLNAANARWGSLYNALYGTDVISESNGAKRGKNITI